MPAIKIQEIARQVFPLSGLGLIAQKIVIFFSQIPILKPLAEYLLGLFMVFVRVSGGNIYYYFGIVNFLINLIYFYSYTLFSKILIEKLSY